MIWSLFLNYASRLYIQKLDKLVKKVFDIPVSKAEFCFYYYYYYHYYYYQNKEGPSWMIGISKRLTFTFPRNFDGQFSYGQNIRT